MTETVLHFTNLVIEAHDLKAPTGWKRLVDDISFELPRGRVLGLIGESGAGKSTIGLAALGYVRPGCRFGAGSRVTLDGHEMSELTQAEAGDLRGRKIAYVAQSAAASFSPSYRLIDQICDVPVRRGWIDKSDARDRARELFRRLRLPDPHTFGERFPHQVSGGQLQRAMIAMALFSNPDVIVFDEPTTALDVVTQVEVLVIAREIIAEFGVAALYITHDLSVVAQIADEIMVLRNGRMVEHGTAEQIIRAPQEDYTSALINDELARKKSGRPAEAQAPAQGMEVTGITAGYAPGLDVLSDVSLTLRPGTVLALVGESGSGKSTMARVISGLLPARAGTISVGGKTLPPQLKDRLLADVGKIQLIHQLPDTALNPRLRISAILDRAIKVFTGHGRAERARIARDLMASVRLDASLLSRFPSQLSGGQKQRVCIARALAAEPEILICDEVTSALDRLVAIDVLALLEDLRVRKNLSVIMITHDMSVVRAIADDVCILLKGRVVEAGSKDDVLSEPYGHEYTGTLLRSVPKIDTGWLDGFLIERAKLGEDPMALRH